MNRISALMASIAVRTGSAAAGVMLNRTISKKTAAFAHRPIDRPIDLLADCSRMLAVTGLARRLI
jgi:hypothetical protein